MSKVAQKLREYADKLDMLEADFGVNVRALRGSACLDEKTWFDLEGADIKKLWKHVKEDDYGFIGIMPNQWRPEIHIRANINGVSIKIYSYVPLATNHYDGGFLDEYANIKKEFIKNEAPSFILAKLDSLYAKCVNSNEKEKLQNEKETLQQKIKDIEEKEKSYTY